MRQKENQKREVSTQLRRKRREPMFNDHPTLSTIGAGPGPGTGITVMNKTLPYPQRTDSLLKELELWATPREWEI